MDASTAAPTPSIAAPPPGAPPLRQRWRRLVLAALLLLAVLVLSAATLLLAREQVRALTRLHETAAAHTLALAAQGRAAEAVALPVGAHGYAYLLDATGTLLSAPPDLTPQTRDLSARAIVQAAQRGAAATRLYQGLEGALVIGRAQAAPDGAWIVVVETPLRAFTPLLAWLIALWVGGVGLAAGISEALWRRLWRPLSAPLRQLTEAARAAAGGDSRVRVRLPAQAGRELAELAAAFNALGARLDEAQRQIDAQTHHLQEIVDRRARQLARKTNHLESAAEIVRALASLHDPRALAVRAVELIQAHYHVYHAELLLIDRQSGRLVPADGIARPGLPDLTLRDAASSVIAWAASSGQTRYVPDISAEPRYRPAPDLPASRCELALPLPGPEGRALGVLNLEADHRDAFDADQIATLEALAAQLAAVLQSAQEFRALEQANNELAQAMLHANQANILKSRFLYNASQKLRQPLDQIVSTTETLISGVHGALPPDALDRQRRILDQGRVIQALVEDMLDLSAIEAGHLQLALQPVALEPLLEEIVNAARALHSAVYPAHRLDIRLDLLQRRASLPPVRADIDRLRYILINLMSNAIKHTPAGEVVLSASATDTDVLITVADSGPGLGDETLRYLFEPFRHQRAPQIIDDAETGLGLPIARLLAMRHGGDLTVETRQGEGTIFTLRLPRAP